MEPLQLKRGLALRCSVTASDRSADDPDQDLSFAKIFFLACLISIALWNASEVILVTYLTYRRLRTLYFWSTMASAAGVIICTVAQIVNLWITAASNFVLAAVTGIGWVLMASGQSLVLYSRLHLLYVNHRILRLVLIMIIINGIMLHSITIVLTMGAHSSTPGPFTFPYCVMEKLQVTAFFIQEAILSGMYLWYSRHFLHKHARRLEDSQDMNVRAVKRTLRLLVITNIIILLLNMSILVLQYLGTSIWQLNNKNFMHSVKLKLEVGVLSQLKDFVQRTQSFDYWSGRDAQPQRRQEDHNKVQWGAAWRRASGTISRSLARRRAAAVEVPDAAGMQETHGAVAARPFWSPGSRVSRASLHRERPEFFNVEMLLFAGSQRGSMQEGVLCKGDSTVCT